MKKNKLNELSLNKKTVTNLHKKQMEEIKGGRQPTWSCSNYLCTIVSAGHHCTKWSLWC